MFFIETDFNAIILYFIFCTVKKVKIYYFNYVCILISDMDNSVV